MSLYSLVLPNFGQRSSRKEKKWSKRRPEIESNVFCLKSHKKHLRDGFKSQIKKIQIISSHPWEEAINLWLPSITVNWLVSGVKDVDGTQNTLEHIQYEEHSHLWFMERQKIFGHVSWYSGIEVSQIQLCILEFNKKTLLSKSVNIESDWIHTWPYFSTPLSQLFIL